MQQLDPEGRLDDKHWHKQGHTQGYDPGHKLAQLLHELTEQAEADHGPDVPQVWDKGRSRARIHNGV